MAVVLDGKQVKDGSIEEVDLSTAVANMLVPDPTGVTDGWVVTKDEQSPGKRKWAAPGAGSAGSENTPIALGDQTDQTAYVVVGSVSLAPGTFPGKTIKFVAVASVVGSITGSVQLYNLSDAAEAALLTFTETSPTRKESSALTLPSGEHIYEVRIKVSETGWVVLGGALFEMR